MTFLSKKFYSMLISGTLTMVVVTLLLISDTVIAGFFIGSGAVEAINLITPAYSMAAFFGGVFSIGVHILYNNAMGRFEKEEADRYFGNGFCASVITGAVMFVLLSFFADAYIGFYDPPADVENFAGPYFFWYRLVILILPLNTFMSEMIFADGDEVLSSLANMVQVVGNIVLSIVLCRFIGIAGIGAASFIGTALSLGISFLHLARKGNSLRINFALSFPVLVEAAKYSIIDAGSYLFLSLFIAIANRFVMTFFGSDMLIMVSICVFIKEIQLVFDGIGEAISPLMSVYMGEETYEGVRNCYKLAERSAIVEGMIVTVIAALASPLIVKVFGITDPQAIIYANNGIRLMALGLTFTSLLYLVTSYYLLREKIVLGLVISALRDVVFSALLGVVGGYCFGLYGMFAGLAISPVIAYALSMTIVAKRYGRDDCPLLLNKLEGDRIGFFYEIPLQPENIISSQQEIAQKLKENSVPEKTIARVKLLIEELFMLIYEKNGSDKVFGECAVRLNDDGVQLIIRDDGVLFDISENDVLASSVAEFAVSSYMEKMKEDKRHLTTMCYNRNVFLVKYS